MMLFDARPAGIVWEWEF